MALTWRQKLQPWCNLGVLQALTVETAQIVKLGNFNGWVFRSSRANSTLTHQDNAAVQAYISLPERASELFSETCPSILDTN